MVSTLSFLSLPLCRNGLHEDTPVSLVSLNSPAFSLKTSKKAINLKVSLANYLQLLSGDIKDIKDSYFWVYIKTRQGRNKDDFQAFKESIILSGNEV